MNNGIREIKVIKPTLGENAERKIRMAAYCRVSTDSEDQINSFMAQMKYYSDYIRSHSNMTFVDIYADEGITGTCIHKREEFKRMLRDCKNRKIDRVIVKSVQRFARNSLECIESVRTLTDCGVSVYFENDNIDTKSMNSEMILYIKSAFAQSESTSASKRMSTSIRMKMENGTFVAHSVPYGYRLADQQLVICHEEAETVKKIFEWYLSGMGVNTIVSKLHETQETVKWTTYHVRYILSNEKYMGDELMQKTYTPEILPLRKKRNRGERAKYYSEDTHEAIVTKDMFTSVQQKLIEKSEKYHHPKKSDQPFWGGKIRCRECGGIYKRINRKDGTAWRCIKKGSPGVFCKSRIYAEGSVFRAFVRMYNTFRQNEKLLLDETITQLQTLKNKTTREISQISEIDSEIALLGDQNAMYSKLFTKGIIDEISYMEKTDSIKRRIGELRIQRSKWLSDDEDERCIEELRKLKRILNEFPISILDADNSLIELIVTQIYAEVNGNLTFCLIGGLQFSVEAESWQIG